MKPTIADIAKEAGVNPSTVSRILNNNREFALSEELREKVRKIAQLLNYEPSFSARSLALGKTYNIAVVLGRIEKSLASPFFSPVITALMKNVMKEGYTISVLPVDEQKDLDEEMLRTVRQRKMDGYFIESDFLGPKTRAELAMLGIPAVAFDPHNEISPEETINVIKCNEAPGATALVKTLIDYGHRDVGYFMLDRETVLPRFSAFHQAAEKHGLNFTMDDRITYQRKAKGFLTDQKEAFNAAKEMKNRFRKYSTIVCASDLTAMGLVDALCNNNSNKLSVIGYDNIEENPNYDVAEPWLTTIDPQKNEVGYQAGNLLLKSLKNKNYKPETVEVSTLFINRKSLKNIN